MRKLITSLFCLVASVLVVVSCENNDQEIEDVLDYLYNADFQGVVTVDGHEWRIHRTNFLERDQSRDLYCFNLTLLEVTNHGTIPSEKAIFCLFSDLADRSAFCTDTLSKASLIHNSDVLPITSYDGIGDGFYTLKQLGRNSFALKLESTVYLQGGFFPEYGDSVKIFVDGRIGVKD